MQLALRQNTKKLFYNRYPFKICTVVKGGSLLRLHSVGYIESYNRTYHRMSDGDISNLKKFELFYNKYKTNGVKIRHEGSHVNFFLKDRVQYESILSELSEFIVKSWETSSVAENQTLLSDSSTVIVDRLPWSKYTHRVFFKKIPPEKRDEVLKSIKRYPDEIKINSSTDQYLNNFIRWHPSPNILIKDPKMLTMLVLSAGNFIHKVERYVLRASINTVSQE